MKAWIYVNLWEIIRDFFVQNFFGGTTSGGVEYHTNIGSMIGVNGSNLGDKQSFYVPISAYNLFNNSEVSYLSFGDWLSTTFTIITFVLFFILIVLFVKWIFKVFSNALLIR